VMVAAVHAYHRFDGLQLPLAFDETRIGREFDELVGH